MTTSTSEITVQGIVSHVYSRRFNGAIFTIDNVNPDTPEKFRIKVKNNVLPVQPSNGEIWVVTGESEYSDEYGMQINAIDCYRERPSGSVLINFLYRNNRFPGLGERKAKRLWNLFGEKLYDILDNEDYDALTDDDKGNIGIKVANTIFAQWKEYTEETPVIKWMQENELPAYLAHRIYEHYGKDTIDKIKSDPYRLLPFSNWRSVDGLALKLGVTKDDHRRHAAAVDEVLFKRLTKGHTAVLTGDLITRVNKLLGNDSKTIRAKSHAWRDTAVEISDKGLYQSSGAHSLEQNIKYRIAKLINPDKESISLFDLSTNFDQNSITDFEADKGIKLNNEQLDTVKTVINNRLSCVLGGAGVGKTTTLSAIISQLDPQWAIFQMALTNRAAKKMTESTGLPSTTIAKFLLDAYENGIPEESWLFIDESSMIDAIQAHRLLKILPPTARLCLIGDPHQLPPIGPGLFFHVLALADKIPKSELIIVHRQAASTGIPAITESIRQRITPSLNEFVDLDIKDHGVSFIHTDNIKEIRDNVLNVYRECTNYGSVQIVAATNKVCEIINMELHNEHRELRKLEGKGIPSLPSYPITIGDPILWHTKNDHKRGLYNGALGVLLEVYDAPIPGIDEHGHEVDHVALANIDGPGIIKLAQSDMEFVKLGYCITVHSAQGSQFERVIVVCEDARIVDNSWLYTSITRTQKQAIIIGHKNIFDKESSSDPRAFNRVIGLDFDI